MGGALISLRRRNFTNEQVGIEYGQIAGIPAYYRWNCSSSSQCAVSSITAANFNVPVYHFLTVRISDQARKKPKAPGLPFQARTILLPT
jgi:hypothetical protein